MRLWMTALLLVGISTSVNAEPLTAPQRALLQVLVEDDLTTFVSGGKSLFENDWSNAVVRWTQDKDIGMRYAHGAIAADAFYGQKVVFIRGRYISADNWIGDAYRVQMWLLAAIVEKTDAEFLGDARNGSTIEMACHVQGQELETAYVKDCVSADVAIRTLARQQAALMASRSDQQDLRMLNLARWADAKIPRDAQCRRADDGCSAEVLALIQKASSSS